MRFTLVGRELGINAPYIKLSRPRTIYEAVKELCEQTELLHQSYAQLRRS